jgi:hypothetical protein
MINLGWLVKRKQEKRELKLNHQLLKNNYTCILEIHIATPNMGAFGDIATVVK